MKSKKHYWFKSLAFSFLILFATSLLNLSLLSGQFSTGAYDIWTYNTGFDTAKLISLPGTNEFDPAWSRNGNWIAFDVVSASDPTDHTIGIANRTGSYVRVFNRRSMRGANNASWRADGRRIIFDKVPAGDLNTYIIKPFTPSPSLFIRNAIDPQYSNRLRRTNYVAFTRPSDNWIYIKNLTTGRETRITKGNNPTWAPFDNALAYDWDGDVFVIYLNAHKRPVGSPRMVAGNPLANEGKPDWRGSFKITYHADYAGEFDIYEKHIFGTSGPILKAGYSGQGDFDPDYNSRHRLVAFSSADLVTPAPPPATISSFNIDHPDNIITVSPNPVHGHTFITLESRVSKKIELNILDASGRKIETIYEGILDPGKNVFNWVPGHHQNVSPGTYYATVHSENEVPVIQKLVVIH
jgi:hypothetical protein